MIPFNHLGFIFNTLGSFIYPTSVRNSLCNFLNPLEKDARVLDIGSGTGMLCKFGYACCDDLKYVAIDPAEGMMKYAKSYVETHIATAEALPFEKDSFDALMMGESLHHLRDIDVSLRECARVLKKDGKLFIYDFNIDSFMGKSICRGEKLLGEPGHFFTPEDLVYKLSSFGFLSQITKHSWRYTIQATNSK